MSLIAIEGVNVRCNTEAQRDRLTSGLIVRPGFALYRADLRSHSLLSSLFQKGSFNFPEKFDCKRKVQWRRAILWGEAYDICSYFDIFESLRAPGCCDEILK
jgi:hypothetical protein